MIGKYFGDFFRQFRIHIRQSLRQIFMDRAFGIACRFRQCPYGKSCVQQHFAEAHASPPNLLVHALFLSCQLRFFLYPMRLRRRLCQSVMAGACCYSFVGMLFGGFLGAGRRCFGRGERCSLGAEHDSLDAEHAHLWTRDTSLWTRSTSDFGRGARHFGRGARPLGAEHGALGAEHRHFGRGALAALDAEHALWTRGTLATLDAEHCSSWTRTLSSLGAGHGLWARSTLPLERGAR